jgi:asparagine synthase (glutamine-hydrolysing)
VQTEVSQIIFELRNRIIQSVEETLGDAILLSGGLDTSIIAAILGSVLKMSKLVRAYTVIVHHVPSPDLKFSKLVSKRFGLIHQVSKVSISDIEQELPHVIRVLKSFDPMEIRNSVIPFIGMKKARLEECSKIMTGDAADELFAGYDFVFKESKEKAIKTSLHLWEVMHFSSIPLAASLEMEARIPFLNPKVKEFAMRRVDFALLVGQNGSEIFGKYALRKAFEDILPAEITWRKKTPIEYGSGSTVLSQIYSQIVLDNEFIDKRKRYLEKDGVRLRDKEQLKYYEIYRGEFGPPTKDDENKKICPACQGNVPDNATFCTICGEYPI